MLNEAFSSPSEGIFKTLNHSFSSPAAHRVACIPLSIDETSQFEAIENAIEAYESGSGSAPSVNMMRLHSRLAKKMVNSLTPAPTLNFSPSNHSIKKLTIPEEAIKLLNTIPIRANTDSLYTSKEYTIPIIANPNLNLSIMQPTNASMVSSPSTNASIVSSPSTTTTFIPNAPTLSSSASHSSMYELNIRLQVVEKAASKLKISFTPFITISADSFSTWSPEGKDVLSFSILANNVLAQSGIFKELWITVLLSAMAGTKILTYFEDNHKLPTTQSEVFSFRRELSPEDIAQWSFKQFMDEFFRLFIDPRFMEAISQYMNIWSPSTFKDPKEAIEKFRHIMAQLALFQSFSGMTSSFENNCDFNKHFFWKCVSKETMVSFTQHCLLATGLLPLDAKAKAPFKTLEKAFRDHFEYAAALSKHTSMDNTISTTHPKTKQISIISAPSSVNFCSFCNKEGHSVERCFKADPTNLTNFICFKCKQSGHVPHKCPKSAS